MIVTDQSPTDLCLTGTAIFGRAVRAGTPLQGQRGGRRPPGSGWTRLRLLDDPGRPWKRLPPYDERTAGPATGGIVHAPGAGEVYLGYYLSAWIRRKLSTPEDPLRVGEHLWVRVAP